MHHCFHVSICSGKHLDFVCASKHLGCLKCKQAKVLLLHRLATDIVEQRRKRLAVCMADLTAVAALRRAPPLLAFMQSLGSTGHCSTGHRGAAAATTAWSMSNDLPGMNGSLRLLTGNRLPHSRHLSTRGSCKQRPMVLPEPAYLTVAFTSFLRFPGS